MTTDLSPITTLLTRHTKAHHRLFIVLSGKRYQSNELAKQLLASLPSANTLCINTLLDQFPDTQSDRQAKSYLGQSTDTLIYDTHEGFDPDAFGILVGTIRGGGLCLLICPELAAWPHESDPINDRLAVYGHQPEALSSYYIQRLTRHIKSHCKALALNHPASLYTLPISKLEPSASTDLPNHEQRQLIDKICELGKASSTLQCLLVTADRGRGKSSAMGIAAARLQSQDSSQRIAVTGPKRKSLEAFYKHYEITHNVTNLDTSCPFFAPDALINNPVELDILLVDEAASIPLPLLETLASLYPKLVFCSTVFGYEGAGRGFGLRFKQMLTQRQYHFEHLTLALPIRYAEHDPLEAFSNKLLLLDAKIINHDNSTKPADDQLVFSIEDKAALAQHETQLSAIFALFVEAHYQTKALDLRHLLDGPNLSIFTLKAHDNIIAAALVATEGQITDPTLQEHITHGIRRPKGHLLAQVLAYQHLQPEYLKLKSARVVRIVVSPTDQQKGYGSLLLEKLEQYCLDHAYDAMGASYGETTSLNTFWLSNGYTILHRGHRKNASSGMNSVVVFKSLSKEAHLASKQSEQRLNRLTQSLTQTPFSNKELSEIKSYALQQRDFEASQYTLARFFSHYKTLLNSNDIALIDDKCLNNMSWNEVAMKHKLDGRKAIERNIKAQCRTILSIIH